MSAGTAHSLLSRLDALRAELLERAFTLDRSGHPAAADVAMEVCAQLAELRSEFGEHAETKSF